MKSISELLKSHPIPGIRLSEIRRTCAAAASTVAKWRIEPAQVRYKSGALFFSVPPVVKTELQLKAEDLKQLLEAAGIECTAIR